MDILFIRKSVPMKKSVFRLSDTNQHVNYDTFDIADEDNMRTVKKSHQKKSFSGAEFSGTKLFNNDLQEIPKLVDPIFPKVGVVSLVGSSDTGKSTILRQLAISVALGLNDFIGYPLNTTSRNVICVSTEDDPFSTSVSLKKVANYMKEAYKADLSRLDHIKFIFDVDNSPSSSNYIVKALRKDLQSVKTDLIIIDAFTDVFNGEINSSTKVREFLNQFSKIAQEFECLIIFLHHTGKRKDKLSASKDNVLGSQAFEAKMRALLELRKHPNDENLRFLAITKGNYLSSAVKKKAKILKFDEKNLVFSVHEENISLSELNSVAKSHPRKKEILNEILQMPENLSIRGITSELQAKGFNISKTSVENYLKEVRLSKGGGITL